ncbi:MAG: MFS transporter [Thermoprotei archaeon]|nr:MFS transporter [TACK group archaeon]
MKPKLSAFAASFSSYSMTWASQVVVNIFLQVYLYSIGYSLIQVGIVGGLIGTFTALLQPPFGEAADALRGRRQYLAALSVAARGAIIIAMVTLAAFPLECVWASLYGAATAPFLPTTMSMVADEGSDKSMGKSMGKFRMAGSIGWTVGNLVFGAVALRSMRDAFLLASSLSLISVIPLVLGKDTRTVAPRDEKRPQSSHMGIGILALFLSSVFAISFTTGAGNQFLPIYLGKLGASTFLVGAVIATGSATEIPFMYAGGRLTDALGDHAVMMVGSLIFSAVYFLYSIISVPSPFLAIQAGRGMAFAMYHSSSMAYSQREPGGRGRRAGLFNSFVSSGSTLGAFAGGFIATALGFRGFFLALSTLAASSAVMAIALKRARSRFSM